MTKMSADTTPTHCGAPMTPSRLADRARTQIGWLCLMCGHESDMRGGGLVTVAPPRRPTLDDRVADLLERGIVAAAITAGEAAGYIVAVIGQRRAKGSGTTEGVGDTLWTRPGDPRWLMQECKTPTGRLRPAQQKLVDAGCMVVYRSADEALENADAAFGRSERDG